MKNRLFLATVLIFFSAFSSQAQYDPSKVNKKALESYQKGMEKAQDGKFDDAIESFREAIQRDAGFIDAYLSLAGVYGQVKNHAQSVALYEKAFSLDSNYTSDLRLAYSINLAGMGEFGKALDAISALLSRTNLAETTRKAAEYRRRSYQFALDFAREHAGDNYVFAPINLGEGINSPESEYFPSLPIAGTEMVFTRRLNNFNEDFFGSIRGGNTWGRAVQLTGGINTPENEGAQSISQDGNWLVFTGCSRPDGYGSCDIYISYKTNSGWSEALNLGPNINTENWESQPCLSPDKRELYFAARRPGGYGGTDLYVARMQANGKWSTPENLGPGINTAGDEFSPFIHADNQTLYFTSNGLLGYGEHDIFLARRSTDGKWQEPENLGYPINTTSHEGTLFIAADGKTAYYASDRSDSRGGLDIYSFEIREGIRPRKTLWIRGQVFDVKTKKGLPSTVELIDLASRQTISRVQTDESGNYLITLPVGNDYAFNVNRRNYLFYSDNYSLKDKSPDSTYEKNIPLQPIEVNAAVVLRNIFFEFNKFDLQPQSQVELDKVVQLMRDNPSVRIQIEGHTDNIGQATDNVKLSTNRAKSVVNYLVQNGIPASRLSFKGFGATRPVADNKSEEGRALNRRTELKVLSR